jgi:ribonuclease BN (tRNA processing enzyme)
MRHRLEITFLGTGGAFCDFRENYHNNAAIKTDDGWLLIDCGGTAVQSLKELGIPVWDVAGVIVTHCHGDHIAGLEQLMWERFYTGANGPGWLKTPIYSTERILKDVRKSLWACMDEFTNMEGVHANGYDALAQPIVPESALNIGDLSISLKKTPHVRGGDNVDKPCYGVWMRKGPAGEEGGVAYYTSDTTFRPDIDVLFPEVDTFFHDCTFTPHYEGTVHTHYSELLTLPADVRCRTVLMHHTSVPDGIDVGRDGFRCAADRHDKFFDGIKL